MSTPKMQISRVCSFIGESKNADSDDDENKSDEWDDLESVDSEGNLTKDPERMKRQTRLNDILCVDIK